MNNSIVTITVYIVNKLYTYQKQKYPGNGEVALFLSIGDLYHPRDNNPNKPHNQKNLWQKESRNSPVR